MADPSRNHPRPHTGGAHTTLDASDQGQERHQALGVQHAYILNVNFVQAFNLMDVVFYRNDDVRQKRKDFLDIATAARDRDLSSAEVERLKDLVAEMLAKMGSELGYQFDHTQIKDTGYYPKAFERLDTAAFALREKGLAVLEGKANIGVVIRDEKAPATTQAASPKDLMGYKK